ncbi:MAG: hypothetical protein ACRELB_10875 [Polyangiaceae bacterium]
MSFAYAASTEGCTFLLDEDGVCLRVLLDDEVRAGRDPTLGGRTRAQAARRCIGAQYVASIDVRVDGALVPMPRVGVPMLFAYTGDDGRIAVVRTGRLLRFETVAPREEIPVEWAEGDDDQCQTVPLHQSGERLTPRVSIFDAEPSDTLRDPWAPPPRAPRPTWSRLPSSVGVRLQRVNVVGPSGSAPTLKRVAASTGRGMLPKKNARG